MEKIWKDIEGYVGLYQVSNTGNVRSLDRWVNHSNRKIFVRGKILKQTLRNNYLRVILSSEGKATHVNVHRLVAEAFIPNVDKKEYVHHIDDNKSNNESSNLMWVSPYENSHDAWKKGLYISGSNSPDSKMSTCEVKDILRHYYESGLYQNIIAKKYNVSQSFISRIIRGETWHFEEDKELILIINEYSSDKGDEL